MLTLGDALGFNDAARGLATMTTFNHEIKTLIDLADDRLQFTPADISQTIRQAANEIQYMLNRCKLPVPILIAFSARTICVVLPRTSSALLFSFLAISGLNCAACLLPDKLPKAEYIKAFTAVECDYLITTAENIGAMNAARSLNTDFSLFEWNFEQEKPRFALLDGDKLDVAPLVADLRICPREYNVCLKEYSTKNKVTSLTHRNLVVSVANMQKTYGFVGVNGTTDEELDIGYCVFPIFHVHGLLFSAIAPLVEQSKVILPAYGFDRNKFWHDICAFQCTYTSCHPTMIQELVDDFDESHELTHCLRFIRTSTSSLSAELTTIAEKLFNVPILQAYGLTTCSHQVSSNGYPSVSDRVVGSIGKPLGVEVAIIGKKNEILARNTIGKIIVRGYSVAERSVEYDPEQNKRFYIPHYAVDWSAEMPSSMAYVSSAIDLNYTRGNRRSSCEIPERPITSCTPAANILDFPAIPGHVCDDDGEPVAQETEEPRFLPTHQDSLLLKAPSGGAVASASSGRRKSILSICPEGTRNSDYGDDGSSALSPLPPIPSNEARELQTVPKAVSSRLFGSTQLPTESSEKRTIVPEGSANRFPPPPQFPTNSPRQEQNCSSIGDERHADSPTQLDSEKHIPHNPTSSVPRRDAAPKSGLVRYASALNTYYHQDFPHRIDPIVSPLPPTMQWYVTGDQGYMNEAGYLYLESGNEDITDIGGLKVSTAEVEFSILKLDLVKECAVIGVRRKAGRWELLALCALNNPEQLAGIPADQCKVDVKLVLGQCTTTKTPAIPDDSRTPAQRLAFELLKELNETLAAHKIPRFYNFVPALPRTLNGEIDRQLIYETYKTEFYQSSRYTKVLSEVKSLFKSIVYH